MRSDNYTKDLIENYLVTDFSAEHRRIFHCIIDWCHPSDCAPIFIFDWSNKNWRPCEYSSAIRPYNWALSQFLLSHQGYRGSVVLTWPPLDFTKCLLSCRGHLQQRWWADSLNNGYFLVLMIGPNLIGRVTSLRFVITLYLARPWLRRHTGAHVVLFCICAHILIKRRNRRQLVLLFATSAMFLVATVDVSLSFNMDLARAPSTFSEKMMLDDITARLYPKNPLYVTNK